MNFLVLVHDDVFPFWSYDDDIPLSILLHSNSVLQEIEQIRDETVIAVLLDKYSDISEAEVTDLISILFPSNKLSIILYHTLYNILTYINNIQRP